MIYRFSDNLGLISNKENKNSRATEDEAEQFLRSKITPSPVVQTPKKVPEYGTIPESADAAEVKRNENANRFLMGINKIIKLFFIYRKMRPWTCYFKK